MDQQKLEFAIGSAVHQQAGAGFAHERNLYEKPKERDAAEFSIVLQKERAMVSAVV
jgi:hypothetical protein